MYVKVQNENYGYSVATYGNYVAVSNPSTLRYDPENEERLCTGSIDYFRYNKNTDEHDHIATLYQPYEELAVILSREHPTPEYDRWDLMTEKNVEYKFPRSKSIEIDKNDYTKSLEDSFGYSIDMYNKNLIVGSPYFYQAVKTYAYSLTSSIATALIYDLGITETPDSDSESNCLIYKLYDPDLGGEEWNSESFGKSVSINGAWAAVGSPSISGSTGMVYLYQAQPTTSYVEGKPHTVVTWSLFKKLEPPNPEPGMEFGYSLKLNKCTSSLSNSLVVGCGNLSHQKAYYFEYINEAWTQSHVFVPDKTIQPMTFAPYLPWDETPVMNESNGFGSAVSLYNDTVIIGAPYDRIFYEYSGSKLYQQGATYIFERCPHPDDEIYEYPRFPNDQIRWNTPNSTAKSIFNFSASFAGNETKPHALININNKIYGGGWDGKLFVFNDPDNNLTDQTWSDCIVDGWISQVTYSEGTKYLYFITTVTRNDAISGKKGYIIKVNPNNINEQEIIFTWTPGTASIGGTVPEAIPPIASDNSYLYTMLRSNYKTTIYKLDITNGNVIKSVVVSTSSDHLINPAMHGGGVFSPDGKWIYFCGGGYVYKINTDTLEYSSVKVQFFYGIADSEIKWEWDPSTEEFKGYWADVALVDDMAYLDGYIYVVADQSGNAFPGGLFKINAETLENVGYIQYEINDGVINYDRYMDIGGYPLPYGSWGVFSDSTNLYLLMGTTNEIFVYPDGDLDSGPVRYPIIGKPNELAFTKAGNIVYTTFSSPIKAYSYKLPFKYNITYPSLFKQVLKTYGNEKVLKNNRMGWSVDIHGNYAVSGIPKVNVETLDSCYIEGTLEQLHFCDSNYENLFSGQTLLLGKNTSSLNWEIINIYQKKKKYLSPYRSYGFDVAVANKSIVVGAPMVLVDSNRDFNIYTTHSNNTDLDDISGKSYIYNFHNFRPEFHVGNVFYRNGKIIIMTSGSMFEGLFLDPVNTYGYEYNLNFKGQHTIFEKQIVCTVNPGEFNVSTNPTAIIRNFSVLDINKNGKVDFQDVDVILRYMKYKHSSFVGEEISTDWSSSIIIEEDEKSLLKWYQQNYNLYGTDDLSEKCILKWETEDVTMQEILDFNEDNKIDNQDMNILWKYFSNRLTQENYAKYITPACKRKIFSDIIDHMNKLTLKNQIPYINPDFFQYEKMVAIDKTGSFLAPMATTIGLYNGLDLVAVAKLGNPIKITPELPINFVIKMDF